MSMLRPPVVLAYHGIGPYDRDCDPARLIVSVDHFAQQIAMLKRRGYTFLTAEGLLEGYEGAKPERPIAVITFDDGLLNNLTIGVPVLRELGVSATFYVCPGMWGAQHEHITGDQGRLMTEDHARTLVDQGMELGGHSMTHPDLRKLDESALHAELIDCKRAIEAVSGKECRTFAYPYGLFDTREQRAVDDCGYGMAFAWMPGPWERLATPRMPGPPRHGARRLALKMLGIHRRRP